MFSRQFTWGKFSLALIFLVIIDRASSCGCSVPQRGLLYFLCSRILRTEQKKERPRKFPAYAWKALPAFKIMAHVRCSSLWRFRWMNCSQNLWWGFHVKRMSTHESKRLEANLCRSLKGCFWFTPLGYFLLQKKLTLYVALLLFFSTHRAACGFPMRWWFDVLLINWSS